MFGLVCKLALCRFSALPRLSRTPSSLLPYSLGILILSLLYLIPFSNAFAAEVTIAWDGVRKPDLAGYTVYYGYASGSYEGSVDVGLQTTTTLVDLAEGHAYYFAVAFYNADGEESELSSEITSDRAGEDSEGNTDDEGSADADEADGTDADSEVMEDGSDEADAVEPDSSPEFEEDFEDEQESDDTQESDGTEVGTGLQVIPPSQLRIVSVSSEPLIGDGAAEAAIDGRPETFWRTVMGAKAPVHPHELVIALGDDYFVGGFRYLPRQDGKTEGMVGRYSLYVSEDGVDWGEAVASGTFPKGTAEAEVTFAGKLGNFVRFVAHTEVTGKPWTSAAEISVLEVR